MIKKIVLILTIQTLIFSCSEESTVIDYNEIEGYYEYLVVDPNQNKIIDTLYKYVDVWGKVNDSDSLKLDMDIFLGKSFLGTKNEILKIRDIDYSDNIFSFKTNKIYSTDLIDNEYWTLNNQDTNYEKHPYISFKCLTKDSTLIYPSGKEIHPIMMILKLVQHYGASWVIGFNENHQIVYYTNYDEGHNYNYLILHKFIKNNLENKVELKEWKNRNDYEWEKIEDIPFELN